MVVSSRSLEISLNTIGHIDQRVCHDVMLGPIMRTDIKFKRAPSFGTGPLMALLYNLIAALVRLDRIIFWTTRWILRGAGNYSRSGHLTRQQSPHAETITGQIDCRWQNSYWQARGPLANWLSSCGSTVGMPMGWGTRGLLALPVSGPVINA